MDSGTVPNSFQKPVSGVRVEIYNSKLPLISKMQELLVAHLYLQAYASKFSPVTISQEWNSPYNTEGRGEKAPLRTRRTVSFLGAQ